MTKKIAILGSTGSIGQQTLDVVAHHPHEFEVTALAANRSTTLLRQQVAQFKPRRVSISDRNVDCLDLEELTYLQMGEEALIDLASQVDVDLVVVATSGTVGLLATLAAIEAGKEIAIANKETLVIGGELVLDAAKEKQVDLRPVDSEHSALWQCVVGEAPEQINKLILTASGGPFRTWSKAQLQQATPEQALRHPNWNMGCKITIDSATLMNKGLEVIEAHWLFEKPYDKIEVLIHPQSIIHSMVEFVDESVKAQLSIPDMRHAIQYALAYPKRLASQFTHLDWTKTSQLTFENPDLERFPCLGLAYEAGQQGGTYPAVLVAAGEMLVDLFLEKRISFCDIASLLESTLAVHESTEITLESIHETMAWAKEKVCMLAN